LQQVGAAERARVNIHVVIARNEKLRQEDAETFATALGARANATLSVRICENKDGPSCPSELQDILEAF
jgi:hypothetical protein